MHLLKAEHNIEYSDFYQVNSLNIELIIDLENSNLLKAKINI